MAAIDHDFSPSLRWSFQGGHPQVDLAADLVALDRLLAEYRLVVERPFERPSDTSACPLE